MPATPHTIHAEMEPGDKSPPKQHTRKRSLADPGKLRAERRVATAAVATDTTAVTVSIQPPRQLADGIASSSASDMPSSAVGSTPPGVMLYFCGQCQKRFRSPAKLAQHERVHTTRTPFLAPFATNRSWRPRGTTEQDFARRRRTTEHWLTPGEGGGGRVNARATKQKQALQDPPTNSGGNPRPNLR